MGQRILKHFLPSDNQGKSHYALILLILFVDVCVKKIFHLGSKLPSPMSKKCPLLKEQDLEACLYSCLLWWVPWTALALMIFWSFFISDYMLFYPKHRWPILSHHPLKNCHTNWNIESDWSCFPYIAQPLTSFPWDPKGLLPSSHTLPIFSVFCQRRSETTYILAVWKWCIFFLKSFYIANLLDWFYSNSKDFN